MTKNRVGDLVIREEGRSGVQGGAWDEVGENDRRTEKMESELGGVTENM